MAHILSISYLIDLKTGGECRLLLDTPCIRQSGALHQHSCGKGRLVQELVMNISYLLLDVLEGLLGFMGGSDSSLSHKIIYKIKKL